MSRRRDADDRKAVHDATGLSGADLQRALEQTDREGRELDISFDKSVSLANRQALIDANREIERRRKAEMGDAGKDTEDPVTRSRRLRAELEGYMREAKEA